MRSFPRKISRIEPLNLVGTARRAVRAAFSGATWGVIHTSRAIRSARWTRAWTSQRDVPTFSGARRSRRFTVRI